MATFDFTGSLPQTKALISSSQLRNRFNDLKTHINTLNPQGWTFPDTTATQHQALLFNTGLAWTLSHVLRSDVALQHDQGNGTAQQALISDGDGTTNWSHVLRSNVDLSHDDGNGSAGEVLQSDGDGTTSWLAFSGLSDGDKGDITVSGTGSTWTIDNDAVTFDKIQDINTSRILGRTTASSGSTEELTVSGGLTLSSGDLSSTPEIVYKTADESVSSSTTLQDDDHLTFSLAANTKYKFRFHLFAYIPNATMGFKSQVTGPASPTNVIYTQKLYQSSGDFAEAKKTSTAFSDAFDSGATWAGASTERGLYIVEGSVENGSNAGSLTIQWSQRTSNGSNLTIERGSFLEIWTF